MGLATSALTFATAAPATAADPVEVQVLATNDFHGRILPNGAEGGAAVLSGAVKQLRDANPNTVFAAAGDLIGASTFESFIQRDKPTIDALNEAGLEVSAVGNHELDGGYADLVDRVMAPASDTNPQGGAAWEYIAANLDETVDNIAESWTVSFGEGENAVEIGFVGAVTEDLPSLVSPSGIEGHLTVEDVVDSVNAETAALKTDGADAIVMLVHEGSPSTDCGSASFTDDGTVWGNISQNVSPDVDAIVSGHTHLAYDCKVAIDGVAGTERPIVSAGQYGVNLNQLNLTVDADEGVTAVETAILPLMGPDPDGNGPQKPPALYEADPVVAAIVSDAAAEAEVLGAEVLGDIEADLTRAKVANGTSENRGGESTLGNLVAEVQRWATSTPEAGAAQIAFMNPGGLRADMGATEVTYREAAGVQPFANTLINMDLTGAQIETLLEQQWQRTSGGTVPSRPFLRLGVSEGFTYTYAETPVTLPGSEEGSTVDTVQGEITGMWLDGAPIDPAASYSVTANSFLAGGGDNFHAFRDAAGKADTGKVDLQAMVDFMAEFAAEMPLPVDYSQRAVEVGPRGPVPPGGQVTFDVASWSMSGPDDVTDSAIEVSFGGAVIGTADVDSTVDDAPYDETGQATVTVTVPADTPLGSHELTLTGNQTGTEVRVPITVTKSAGCTNAEKGHAQAQASLAKAKDKKASFKKKLKKAKKADKPAKKVKKLQKKFKKAKKQVNKATTGLVNAQANVGKHC